jgi:hypothetical protein
LHTKLIDLAEKQTNNAHAERRGYYKTEIVKITALLYMQQIAPHTTRPLPKRRAKAPLEIDLKGPVGELVAAEFAWQREHINQLKAQIEILVEQTQRPILTFTEDDFEAMFGLKQRAQQVYRKNGKLDCIKLGEKVLYTRQHLDEFIARFDTRNKNKSLEYPLVELSDIKP